MSPAARAHADLQRIRARFARALAKVNQLIAEASLGLEDDYRAYSDLIYRAQRARDGLYPIEHEIAAADPTGGVAAMVEISKASSRLRAATIAGDDIRKDRLNSQVEAKIAAEADGLRQRYAGAGR